MFKKSLCVFFIFSTIAIYSQSKMGVGINAGFFSPTGTMGDLVDAGFGGSAGLTYMLSENFQLGLSAGYISYAFNENALDDFYQEIGVGSTNVKIDGNVTFIPVMLSAKYFFSSATFKPYGTLDLGMHFASTDGATVFEGLVSDSKSASESKTGWGIGFGFLYDISKSTAIDVSAKFNGTGVEFGKKFESPTYSVSETSTGTWFSITGGVHIGI